MGQTRRRSNGRISVNRVPTNPVENRLIPTTGRSKPLNRNNFYTEIPETFLGRYPENFPEKVRKFLRSRAAAHGGAWAPLNRNNFYTEIPEKFLGRYPENFPEKVRKFLRSCAAASGSVDPAETGAILSASTVPATYPTATKAKTQPIGSKTRNPNGT